jgi:nickel-dependent lactate racemase
MSIDFHYGVRGKICLNPSNKALLADCSVVQGTPLPDTQSAVSAALAAPLNFPPFCRATVPGDRVAIAVEGGLPQAESIVAGLVLALLDGSVEAADVAIVAAADYQAAHYQTADPSRLTSRLPDGVRQAVELHVHDPGDKSQLAYLAASREGKPIYLNRVLCDADVVLPVGTMRLDETLGYVGVHGALFPTFADQATQQRFRAPSSTNWRALHNRRREEADEAAWLLGTQFTLQVVPGAGDDVLHVLAGDADSVRARGRELCAAAWLRQSPGRARLVVASIEGGPEQQTWENFARALYAASQAVDDDGAIVLCTELDAALGPALQQLTSWADDESVLHELMRSNSPDALTATLLLQLRERANVFLLSQLDGDLVENLGLGHVEVAEDVDRLCRQFESCILLSNANRAFVAIPNLAPCP